MRQIQQYYYDPNGNMVSRAPSVSRAGGAAAVPKLGIFAQGDDAPLIQQILGHTSILATQIYTHVSSAKQARILAEKHPRNRL